LRTVQLVVRVIDNLAIVADRHSAAGGESTTRLDACDLAPAQPHQRDQVAAVVEIGLEGRQVRSWSVDDGAQPTGDCDELAAPRLPHRRAAGRPSLGAQPLRVELRLARDEPAQQAAQPGALRPRLAVTPPGCHPDWSRPPPPT